MVERMDITDRQLTGIVRAVHLTVNDREYTLEIDPCESLLDVLRERLDLTGTKKGCDQGACGAPPWRVRTAGTRSWAAATGASRRTPRTWRLPSSPARRCTYRGPAGERTMLLDTFYREPGSNPHLETSIDHGDLIIAVSMPALPGGGRSVYLKVRERASYEFALVSVAASVALDGGLIGEARVALGGVATRPWRARETEAMLAGVALDDRAAIREAASAAFAAAWPLRDKRLQDRAWHSGDRARPAASRRCGMNTLIGPARDRVDGPAKVTGAARYSAEIHLPGLVHGVFAPSTAAAGRLTRIDVAGAERAPGVIAVFTHQTMPRLARQPVFSCLKLSGMSFSFLQDDRILYGGQPIAMVIACTREQAVSAAELIDAEYTHEPPVATLADAEANARELDKLFGIFPAAYRRGDTDARLLRAEVRVSASYTYPAQRHHPLELSSTTAVWDGPRLSLTVYETTQGVSMTQLNLCDRLDLEPENVRVISRFLGGGFGVKGCSGCTPP